MYQIRYIRPLRDSSSHCIPSNEGSSESTFFHPKLVEHDILDQVERVQVEEEQVLQVVEEIVTDRVLHDKVVRVGCSLLEV